MGEQHDVPMGSLTAEGGRRANGAKPEEWHGPRLLRMGMKKEAASSRGSKARGITAERGYRREDDAGTKPGPPLSRR